MEERKIKKFFAILIIISIVMATPIPSNASQLETQTYIITFNGSIDNQLLSHDNAQVLHVYKTINAVAVSMTSKAVRSIEASPEIRTIELNKPVYQAGQISSWGLTNIRSSTYKKAAITGKGVNIAVLDSGVGPHDDLNVVGGVSFVSYTTSYNDDNGHGTHVAGIIAAKDNDMGVVGVAPDANIYSVKVLNQDGQGDVTSIISGIDWSITHKMDIINLSLGTNEDSPALKEELDKAYKSGILIVAAAGNDGPLGTLKDNVEYPARYSSVIAVAATDSNNNHSSFSSMGNEVEIAAPGSNIVSTYPGNKYAEASGTSMASGFVSGYLALLKKRFPNDSIDELRSLLQRSSLDLGSKGRDPVYGYGLLQEHLVNTERLAGKDRFEVAVNVANQGWKTANTVFLANYLAFSDALTAAPLAYKQNAPILLTLKDKLPDNIKNELTKLHASNVVIVGGNGSVSETVANELKTMGMNVTRIGGKDRFEVAVNIANTLGGVGKIVIANGLEFPDALSIAPYAAAKGYPIVLTENNTIPITTKQFLQASQASGTIVVGGEGSVANSELSEFPNPIRISGKDRFEVSNNIINQFYPTLDTVYVSTGLTFADALTGSVLAAKRQSPMVLTWPDHLAESELATLRNKDIKHAIVIGGAGSVNESVFNTLLN